MTVQDIKKPETETITAAHDIILNEDAPELSIGDVVAITVRSWEGGEREIKGEIADLYLHGRVKLRIGRSAVNVSAHACRVVLAASHRRAA
ncbi:MAG: hypothetical protein HEQ16_05140 [Bosea sp.]|jgi:hypothetical protein|nr:hypothetical protein [Bosea sp. (in: a-proteobacteria)]